MTRVYNEYYSYILSLGFIVCKRQQCIRFFLHVQMPEYVRLCV